MSSSPKLRRTLPELARLVRRFGPEVRRERRLITGATALLVAEVGFRLLEPWPLKWVIDEVVSGDADRGNGPPFLDGAGTETVILLAALSVVVIAGLRALAAYLSTVGLALAGNRVLTAVRARLFAHVQRLSLGFHDRARTGDLVTRLTGDVGRLQEVAVTAALPLLANVLTVIGMLVVMLWLNPLLTLAALVALPLLSPTLLRRSAKIQHVARRQRKQEGALATIATETLGAMRLVQALGLEDKLQRRFAKQNDGSLREGVRAKRLAAGLERKVDVFVALGTALVLYVGALQVTRGQLTPGELVVFLLYLKIALKPMRDLAKYSGRLARAAASGERIVDLLDVAPDIVERPGARSLPRVAGDRRCEGVSLDYDGEGRHALRDVSFHVRPGGGLAIVGPSGAGKSTALALIPRLYDPQQGRILLDGHDLRDVSLASLRSQVSMVLQDSVLFGGTIAENIALGATDVAHDAVVAAARLANAHEFIERLPRGYDTVVGERGTTLSGGQRQRIAIARAAIRDAPILLLDEPLAGLDEDNERLVMAALRRLAAERTTIMVSHDLRLIDGADEILYVDRGEVVERGTHDALMALDGCYAAVYRVQAARGGDPFEWHAGVGG